MRAMTETDLSAAFAGESQAHMRYLAFAQAAEERGRPEVAKLFRVIAFAEQVHATNHLKALDKLKSDRENLQAAVEGETYEVEEMYPAFLAVAKLQHEAGAEESMGWALETEKVHIGLYEQALQAVSAGRDRAPGKLYVCEVCGYTGEGDAPDRCPVCGAARNRIREF